MAWSDGLIAGTAAYQIAATNNSLVRVVAGPGTGKSFAMKRRVARFLEQGISAHSILPVTFTRVAAEDLHRELVGMGVSGCDELRGTTLHSLALRILMRNHVLSATGRIPRPLNDFEIKPMEADLASRYGGKIEFRKKIKAYGAAWARLQRDVPGYAPSSDDIQFEADLIGWLIFHHAMLIGEVIPRLYAYLVSNPGAAERSEFSHVLVDEYQDLNKAEQGVIELVSQGANVCIVGDDDQSIYSFKYAHPEGIREWIISHPLADDISLSECRRCPTRVVDMAASLIGHNINRPVPRPLLPLNSNGGGDVQVIQFSQISNEISGIASIIQQLIQSGINPGDILVLAQRSVIGTPIYEMLVARGISTKSYYADSELETEDAQTSFALLKLFVDREDRVALRWLLGIHSTTWQSNGYKQVRNHCEMSGDTPWTAFEKLEAGSLSISRTSHIIAKFSQIRIELEKLELIYASAGLVGVIDQLFSATNPNVRDLRAVALATMTTIGTDRAEFLKELLHTIAQPEIPSEIQDVRVMSLHKSKGLSAHVTIIAGCIEGLLPKQPDDTLPRAEQVAELEEQRRLFYVGITRVKSVPSQGVVGTLILTYSQQMPMASAMRAGISPAQFRYGNARTHASRFIQEMGPQTPTPIFM